jgi:transcriptional regulator with XRE-family HTH domain
MKGKRKSKGSGSLLDEQQETIKKIGARIKALRIAKGHSSYEIFAYEHDIDRSQYGKYERGVDMRISSLVKIFAALDVTLEEFFSEGFED